MEPGDTVTVDGQKLTILGTLLGRSPYNPDYTLEEDFDGVVDMYKYRYASDGVSVYLLENGVLQQKYPNSDQASFEVMTHDCARDKNNVYWSGVPTKGIDAASFEIVQYDPVHDLCIARDKKRVYSFATPLKHVAPASFTALNMWYGKDSEAVISLITGARLKDADPDSFIVLDESGGAEDVNHTYTLQLTKQYQDDAHHTELLTNDPLWCLREGVAYISIQPK